MATTPPKVQLITCDDGVSVDIYVNGKCVDGSSYNTVGSDGIDAVWRTARAVAEALGATVEDATEPDRQKWRYFVTYQVTSGGLLKNIISAGPVILQFSAWFDLDHDIDGPGTLQPVIDELTRRYDNQDRIDILGFQLIDGPF